jgi:uncharacterized lipoprotein NlpE involved in copper resistance
MKKAIILLTISLVMLMFFSCNNKKEKQQFVAEVPSYSKLANDEKERTRLWKAAIDSGNCDAYNKIAIAYLMTYKEVDLYYYSLIMANKYHCPEAYRNLSSILTHEASTGDMVILSDDKDTKNLALYYLFKAKELGSAQAKNGIELEFGKGKRVPNSSFFLKQLMTN